MGVREFGCPGTWGIPNRGVLWYEQARKGRHWTIDSLFPKWMLPAGLLKHFKNMWEAIPVSLRRPSFIRESLLAQSISEWWSKWASDISPWAPLHVIDTADFVEVSESAVPLFHTPIRLGPD